MWRRQEDELLMTDDDMCYLPAVTMARMLRDRTICAREVITAHLNRIEAYNTEVNAIVTLTADAALDEAAAADHRAGGDGRAGVGECELENPEREQSDAGGAICRRQTLKGKAM